MRFQISTASEENNIKNQETQLKQEDTGIHIYVLYHILETRDYSYAQSLMSAHTVPKGFY